MRIWAKIIKDDKIQSDYIYQSSEKFTLKNFEIYLCDICNHLDLSKPILIKKDIQHFRNFHNIRFRQNSFLESIDFDYLMLEFLQDNAKSSKQ